MKIFGFSATRGFICCLCFCILFVQGCRIVLPWALTRLVDNLWKLVENTSRQMLSNVCLSTILKGMLSSPLFYSIDELKFWRLRFLPWLPQVSNCTRFIVRFESKSSFSSHVFHQRGSLISFPPSDTCFIPDQVKSVVVFFYFQHNRGGSRNFCLGVGEGVLTFVQKGLSDFSVANYFSPIPPTHPPTIRGCTL